MQASASNLAAAAVLGATAGSRTFGPWAGLVASGRVTDRRVRVALCVAIAGELVVDKLPMTPPRTDPRGLAGRGVSSALAGRLVAGPAGAALAAATALGAAFAFQRARARLGERAGLPDAVIAGAEDVAALGAAVLVARA